MTDRPASATPVPRPDLPTTGPAPQPGVQPVSGESAAEAEFDDDGFKHELLRALPHLRAFARGLSGRADFADDLVQEAAIKAWTARRRYTPGTNMRAWTFAILRNHYLSELRRSRRQTDLDEGAIEKMLVMEADQEGPLHLSDMEAALQKLAPERREAVLLVGAGGFSYEEAAEVAGCPVGTMKSRVARARADLARMLAAETQAEVAAATPRGSRKAPTPR